MKRYLFMLPFAVLAFIGLASVAPPAAHAQDTPTVTCPDGRVVPKTSGATDQELCNPCSGSFLGIPTWYRYLEVGPKDGDPCAIIGPTDAEGELDIRAAIYRVGLAVIEIMMRLAVIIAAIFVIVGGFRYITSQGEPENAKSARQTITNALIGMVVSLLATGLVAFIANRLTQ